MKILRSFFPIGQGAFFRETFLYGENKNNVVYDCGSSLNSTLVETTIRNEFSKDETIDALFISHFDEDHINGIPFLLEYCNVRRIFFPLLTTRDKISLQLYSLSTMGRNGVAYRFLHNPYLFLQEHCQYQRPRLLQVSPAEIDKDDFNGIDANIIQSGQPVDAIGFNQEKFDWEFIPFNFRQEMRSKIFMDELEKNLSKHHLKLDAINEMNMVEIYEEHKDEIIAAFKVVPGKFNTNSMCLFSGIRNKASVQKPFCGRYIKRCYCRSELKPIGCLYTGDYEASGMNKWKELKEAYMNYWDYIGCIQVPHHGSKYNYNHEFALIDAYFIVSAGLNNKYRHPHSAVVKDLLLNGRNLCWVSELRNSQVDLICMP